MRVYTSGHIKKKGDAPDAHWRDMFNFYFEKLVTDHYKRTKVFPLPPLRFLHPLDDANLEINAARDKFLMNQCDIAVVYLNLKIGRCLGAMFETGYLVAHNKPIILINESTDVGATKFIEYNSDVVAHSIEEGATILYNMIKDVTEVDTLI